MTPTAPYEGETGFNVLLSWSPNHERFLTARSPTVVTRAHSDKKEKNRVSPWRKEPQGRSAQPSPQNVILDGAKQE